MKYHLSRLLQICNNILKNEVSVENAQISEIGPDFISDLREKLRILQEQQANEKALHDLSAVSKNSHLLDNG